MSSNGIELALTLPAHVRVLMPHGHVEEMKLETYLAGVIAAQIGTTAPLEALKAQAVASRTYVAAARRHPEQNADVCIAAHCQKWIRVDPVSAPEVFRALGETWGLVTMYNGSLINAFFFEHCDGHTRNSEDMLMPETPYLRGVDCSCGFLTMRGHGVGMCMRGAIVMARRGASFEQILQHYYRGVRVIRIATENLAEPELEEAQPPRAPTSPKKQSASKKATEPAHKRKGERERRPTRAAPKLKRPVIPPSRPKAPPMEEQPAPIVEPPKPAVEPIAPPAQIIEPEHYEVIESTAPILPMESSTEVAEPVTPMEAAPIEPIHAEEPTPVEEVMPVELPPTIAEPVTETPVVEETEPSIATGPIVQVESASTVAEADLPALEENLVREEQFYHVDQLPGARMIAGCLPQVGLTIQIEDPHGNQMMMFSGCAPHYGAGGFETMVDEDGKYRVTIDGQTIEVKVAGETAFIHTGAD